MPLVPRILLSLALLCGLTPATLLADIVRPAQALLQTGTDTPPVLASLPASSKWLTPVPPRLRANIGFDLGHAVAAEAAGQQAVYLPHVYDGGRVWLNGVLIAAIPESDARQKIRWRQPHLIPLPAGLLRAQGNRLDIDVPVPSAKVAAYIARPGIGPLEELAPQARWRAFWMQGAAQVTLVTSLLFSFGMLLIWLMRRSEVLYGLFGLACLFWGLRTLTFLIDVVPTDYWLAWRAFHHLTAVGSATTVALFSLRLAGMVRPWLERSMVGLTALTPLAMLIPGEQTDTLVGQISGLISLFGIGGVAVGAAVMAAWRQRSLPAWVVLDAYGLLLLAGLHDYLMYWYATELNAHFPTWVEHSPLLLRYAVSVLLLTFAAILLHRFVTTLDKLEDLNRTLEDRVAERESQLQRNYLRLSLMERERATIEERQRIMRDMHDGLGSQLFVALSRIQRGALSPGEMVDTLKACVADMRLALEALAPTDGDFITAFGDFRYRWTSQLTAAGLNSNWQLRDSGQPLAPSPHVSLQLLRLLQEALTNVLKHARASQVMVRVHIAHPVLHLEVEDNGMGMPPDRQHEGQGLKNMRVRAQRLGAELEIESAPGRTVVRVVYGPARPD